MQKPLKQKTNSPQDSRSTELVIRKWLVVFGSLFNREITPFLIGSWCELLQDIPSAMLERACRQAANTCKFFPTPADVLAQFQNAEEKGMALEAEQAWQTLLQWVSDNYYPDFGVKQGAPRLSAVIEHAARAAGGYAWIESCPRDELVWCRKNFLAAYTTVHETGLVEHLLTRSEAKRILTSLAAGPRALPTHVEQREAELDDPEGRADFLEKAREITKATETLPTDEELRRRAEEQKHRQQAFLAELGQNPNAAQRSKNPAAGGAASD